jgi:hypothetical protein
MKSKHEQFCKERLFLTNVSPRTIECHKQSLKWLGIEEPTEGDLKGPAPTVVQPASVPVPAPVRSAAMALGGMS